MLLCLVTQSAARAALYAETAVDEYGFEAAMIEEVNVQTEHGSYKAGEYVRALAQLEAQERDRCANSAAKAIAAGLNERMVRLAERQGEMLGAVVMTALSEVSLPADKAAALKASIARRVRELG